MTSNAALTVVCDVCGFPVHRGTGHVAILAADLARAEVARSAWERDREAELFDAGAPEPVLARFRVRHEQCAQPLCDEDWWLPVSAIDTPAATTATGALVASKPWHHLTDWETFCRRLTGE